MDKCECKIERYAWNDMPTGKYYLCPLHAAAPALLKVLTRATDQLGAHYGNDEPLVRDCRAAIALAKGETS